MSPAASWLEWLVRASLPLIAVSLVGMYAQSERHLVIIQMHTKEIAELKADLAAVKNQYATKTDLQESVKSIDQKLEIMLLRQQNKR